MDTSRYSTLLCQQSDNRTHYTSHRHGWSNLNKSPAAFYTPHPIRRRQTKTALPQHWRNSKPCGKAEFVSWLTLSNVVINIHSAIHRKEIAMSFTANGFRLPRCLFSTVAADCFAEFWNISVRIINSRHIGYIIFMPTMLFHNIILYGGAGPKPASKAQRRQVPFK